MGKKLIFNLHKNYILITILEKLNIYYELYI